MVIQFICLFAFLALWLLCLHSGRFLGLVLGYVDSGAVGRTRGVLLEHEQILEEVFRLEFLDAGDFFAIEEDWLVAF